MESSCKMLCRKWIYLCHNSHGKAILGRGYPGLMRWILVWTMPQVQDQWLDLLTCSPVCYSCPQAVQETVSVIWYLPYLWMPWCSIDGIHALSHYPDREDMFPKLQCYYGSLLYLKMAGFKSEMVAPWDWWLPTQLWITICSYINWRIVVL